MSDSTACRSIISGRHPQARFADNRTQRHTRRQKRGSCRGDRPGTERRGRRHLGTGPPDDQKGDGTDRTAAGPKRTAIVEQAERARLVTAVGRCFETRRALASHALKWKQALVLDDSVRVPDIGDVLCHGLCLTGDRVRVRETFDAVESIARTARSSLTPDPMTALASLAAASGSSRMKFVASTCAETSPSATSVSSTTRCWANSTVTG